MFPSKVSEILLLRDGSANCRQVNAARSWSLTVDRQARQSPNHDTRLTRQLPKEDRRWVNNLSPACFKSLCWYELIHASFVYLLTNL